MEEMVECIYCGERVGLSEAKGMGWVSHVKKVGDQDMTLWEHEPKKIWDNQTGKYINHPFCQAKKIRKGVHPHRMG